jgi:hypothetical protein
MAIGSEEGVFEVPKGEDTVIPFSDDVEEQQADAAGDDPDPDEPGITEDVKKSRRARRAERLRERLQKGEEAQRQAEELRRQIEEMRANQARLEGLVQGRLSAQPQTPQLDPYQQKLQQIEEQREMYRLQAAQEIEEKRWTPERKAYYNQIGDRLDQERVNTLVQRQLAQQLPQLQAQVQTTVAANTWASRYPDVHTNERALRWAKSKYELEIAEGKPPTQETIERVYEETRAKFQTGPKPKPSANERALFEGIPTQGNQKSAGPAKGSGIKMTPELKRIARAAYPGMDPEQAYKKWVQTTGKKLREDGIL